MLYNKDRRVSKIQAIYSICHSYSVCQSPSNATTKPTTSSAKHVGCCHPTTSHYPTTTNSKYTACTYWRKTIITHINTTSSATTTTIDQSRVTMMSHHNFFLSMTKGGEGYRILIYVNRTLLKNTSVVWWPLVWFFFSSIFLLYLLSGWLCPSIMIGTISFLFVGL